jgi:hypothetical protein
MTPQDTLRVTEGCSSPSVAEQVFSGDFYRLEFSYGKLVKWSHTLKCDK